MMLPLAGMHHRIQTAGGKVGLIDYGQSKRLPDSYRAAFAQLVRCCCATLYCIVLPLPPRRFEGRAAFADVHRLWRSQGCPWAQGQRNTNRNALSTSRTCFLAA